MLEYVLTMKEKVKPTKKKTKEILATRDLEFLFEIGTLRHIKRSWSRFLNPDYQNLAEHHLKVIWIALLIAEHEGQVDKEKIVKLAIVHDVGESRTGDVDYLSRQYVIRDEELGIKDVFEGTIFEKEFISLWKEYEDRTSLEAKIVKDADNLDVDFEIKEQESRGNRIGDGFIEHRKLIKKKFYTKTAGEIWKRIQKANPHDWHYKGRNRYNAGDWKEMR